MIVFGTKAGKQILKNLSKDSELKEVFEVFFKELFLSKPIEEAGSDFANHVVKHLIFDEGYKPLRNDTEEFVKSLLKSIVQDELVKHHSSNFVWSTVNRGLNPIWWVWKESPINKTVDEKQ